MMSLARVGVMCHLLSIRFTMSDSAMDIVTSWTLGDAIESADKLPKERFLVRPHSDHQYKWFSIRLELPPCEEDNPWDTMTEEQQIATRALHIDDSDDVSWLHSDGTSLSGNEYMNRFAKTYNLVNSFRCMEQVQGLVSSVTDVVAVHKNITGHSVTVQASFHVDDTTMIDRLYAACSDEDTTHWKVGSITTVEPNAPKYVVSEVEEEHDDRPLATKLVESQNQGQDTCYWVWEEWVNPTLESLEGVPLAEKGDMIVPRGTLSIKGTTIDFGERDIWSEYNEALISTTRSSLAVLSFLLMYSTIRITLAPCETRWILRGYITTPLRGKLAASEGVKRIYNTTSGTLYTGHAAV